MTGLHRPLYAAFGFEDSSRELLLRGMTPMDRLKSMAIRNVCGSVVRLCLESME
jgi:hypothetical protein